MIAVPGQPDCLAVGTHILHICRRSVLVLQERFLSRGVRLPCLATLSLAIVLLIRRSHHLLWISPAVHDDHAHAECTQQSSTPLVNAASSQLQCTANRCVGPERGLRLSTSDGLAVGLYLLYARHSLLQSGCENLGALVHRRLCQSADSFWQAWQQYAWPVCPLRRPWQLPSQTGS